MKLIIAFVFFLISLSAFCQTGQIAGQIKKQDTLLEFKYLVVELKLGDSIIKKTVPDTNGHFSLNNIAEGFYSLVIHQIGYRDDVTDSLKISKDTTIALNFIYPPPCNFLYSKGQKPKCIGGHTENIIPIVYGLPAKKTIEKAKKGLVHLAGCIVSDCDPHYYCTIHKREL